MNRLRIMHVIDSLGTGGTEAGVRKLLAGLDPNAFEQIVCTVRPSRETESIAGGRVVSLGLPGKEKRVLVGKLKRLFDCERPHLVHSRNWGAIESIAAARMAGIRAIVHSEHGFESATYLRQPRRRNVIRRICFSWANRVFTVTRSLQAYYSRQLWIDKNRIGVIPNGVDTERFRALHEVRIAARQRLGVSSDTLVIGSVGRLDPIKDHRVLFKAAELLLAANLNIHLVIVGDGPTRTALEADVSASRFLAGHTSFLGECTDIVSQLNSFDVFVLPSLAEGMSNALLEAMSVGVPCVVTRVGGNPELIEGGSSGLLFESGDTKMLTTHLQRLAMNRGFREGLGRSARQRVEDHFSLRRMLTNYTHLYEEALSSRLPMSFAS